MAASASTSDDGRDLGRQFRTTHWSAVLRAGSGDGAEAGPALNELCRTYWYPIYAFARRLGHGPAAAEDLTQGFFLRLFEQNAVAGADPEKGRFRSYLLTAFRRFAANEWHRAHSQKRGGFQTAVPLDISEAESRFGSEPSGGESPDRQYDRHWGMALLDRVMQRLEAEYTTSGRATLFARLEPCLARDETAAPYAVIASELELSEAAVKMAVQRLRGRFRAILRQEIADTVASPADVEAELEHLFAAFRT